MEGLKCIWNNQKMLNEENFVEFWGIGNSCKQKPKQKEKELEKDGILHNKNERI